MQSGLQKAAVTEGKQKQFSVSYLPKIRISTEQSSCHDILLPWQLFSLDNRVFNTVTSNYSLVQEPRRHYWKGPCFCYKQLLLLTCTLSKIKEIKNLI